MLDEVEIDEGAVLSPFVTLDEQYPHRTSLSRQLVQLRGARLRDWRFRNVRARRAVQRQRTDRGFRLHRGGGDSSTGQTRFPPRHWSRRNDWNGCRRRARRRRAWNDRRRSSSSSLRARDSLTMLNTSFPDWPSFTTEEADAVSRVLLSNRVNYWTGEECRKFESEFCKILLDRPTRSR